jgi:TonB-linked SusC/RagA family outer membrane protein
MKKTNPWGIAPDNPLKKILLTMRIVFALLVLGILHANATNAYSQQTRLSLDITDAQLVAVLDEIEDLSEFYFLYNEKLLDIERKVSVKADNELIDEILKGLFAGTDVTFTIYDRKIILAPDFDAGAMGVQQSRVSGTVKEANGNPLPGVTVQIKGTSIGVLTDVAGNFELTDVPQSAILVFSFVGMKSQEIPVGNNTLFNVVMTVDLIGMEEIVVTGYATQTKASLTGSVATVGTEELLTVPATNVVQRLQGRISGVSIINSHVPGGDATVRIRGLGTINNNDPLYVIDGVPTKEGLSSINPNDIESITVLKDAASSAIYGASGANGVIIVTTRHGKGQEPSIRVDIKGGISQITKTYDLLNTQEYGELLWLEAQNDGVTPGNAIYGYGSSPDIPDYILPARAEEGSPEVDPSRYSYNPKNLYLIMKANKTGTDWYDEILRPAPFQDYNFSINGGTNNAGYAISAGYLHEEGILINTGYKRYSIRANSQMSITDWLEIGENIGVTFSKGYGNQMNNNENASIFAAVRIQPIIPVYDIMGNFAGTKAPSTSGGENPVATLTRDQNDYTTTLRNLGNLYAQAKITDWLSFKTLFGFDLRQRNTKDIFIKNPESSMASLTDGLTEGAYNNVQWNWQNLLMINKEFGGNHSLSVLLGTEALNYKYLYITAARNTYFSTDVNYMYLSAGESNQTNSGLGSEYATMSYFGKLNYAFASKYLLEATYRRDGSSRFGQNNRWGNFPAFSVGWRITEEPFMGLTSHWLDDLKLRLAWGTTGNSEIGNYNGFTTFRTNPSYSYYGLDGNNTSANAGFDSNAFGNPDAKWETTTTTDIGVDALLFNGSFTVTFDLWKRNTSDMLFVVPQPSVMGQATLPSVNIGDMKNSGFDLALGYRNEALGGRFNYNITANIYHYKNEILKLTGEEKLFHSGVSLRDMMYTAYNVGTSFPEFYGYKVVGIFQTQAEADAWPKAFGENGTYNEPGHFKYEDVTKDGVIDANDRTWIGSPHPDFTAGLNIDLSYMNFDLQSFLFLSYGNEIISYVRRWIDYTIFQGNRSKDRLYTSWGSPYLEDNSQAKLAKASYLNDTGNQYPSTHFVEDGSYLRMKSIQLGYALPQKITGKLGFSSIRAYIQTTNLFTITRFNGLDPEIDPSSSLALGLDQGAWPTPRQFVIGISAGF